jgi:STE24 endopeptidase
MSDSSAYNLRRNRLQSIALLSIGCLLMLRLGALADTRPAVSIPSLPPDTVAYNLFRYVFGFVSMAWVVTAYLLLIRCRFGPRVRDALERRIANPLVRQAAFYMCLLLALSAWGLPLGLISYAHERAYGYATQSMGLWITDQMKSFLLALAVTVPAVWLGYALVRRSPQRWWLWLWAISVPWQFAIIVLRPVVVAPLYNRFVPMSDAALRDRLTALADHAGVRGARVYQVDISRRTKKLNAYVTGLGPSRRIVLWDTTLKALTEDEIAAIMAHELGHYVLGHMWWRLGESVVGAFVLLWLLARLYPWAIERWGKRGGVRDVLDIAGLPIFSLVLHLLIVAQTPVESALSRMHEWEADRYGLALNRDGESMARAFVVFVERDRSDPDPPRFIQWWFGSHPTLRERVEHALAFDRGRQSAQ